MPEFHRAENKVGTVDADAPDCIFRGIIDQNNSAAPVPIPQRPGGQKSGAAPESQKHNIKGFAAGCKAFRPKKAPQTQGQMVQYAILRNPGAELFRACRAVVAYSHLHARHFSPPFDSSPNFLMRL
jgi:hypothetical protein